MNAGRIRALLSALRYLGLRVYDIEVASPGLVVSRDSVKCGEPYVHALRVEHKDDCRRFRVCLVTNGLLVERISDGAPLECDRRSLALKERLIAYEGVKE
jgi:hypothetical protein